MEKAWAISKYLFLFLSSLLAGLFLRSFFTVDILLVGAGVFVISLAVAVSWYGTVSRWKLISLVAMFALGFVFGLWRADASLAFARDERWEGSIISSTGVVSAEPVQSKRSQRLTITLNSCEEDIAYCHGGRVLYWAPKWEEFSYGDKLVLNCTLKKIENFTDEFDWHMYLAKDRIFYECADGRVSRTKETGGNIFVGTLMQVREKLEANINQVVPQPEAALGNGLLFGGSERLSEDMQEKFSDTSMTHIVAVSGYNVSILSAYFLIIATTIGFKRQRAFWFAVLGVFIFVAMIGFPSSAIRAGIMGVMLLWAIRQGKLSESVRVLLFAGVIMLAWNPLLLRYDIGFQLSFLATLGILLGSIFWGDLARGEDKTFGLKDTLFVTLAAQLFVLPLILYHFHQFSILSLAANLLILGIVPITMLFVFLASVLGFVFLPLAQVFGWLGYLLLRYETLVIEVLASMKSFLWSFDGFDLVHLLVWYVVSFGIVIFLHVRRYRKQKLTCPAYVHA